MSRALMTVSLRFSSRRRKDTEAERLYMAPATMIEAWRTVKASAGRLGKRGAAAVEFAIVAPVLLLIMVGTAQFGIALNQYVMLTNAVAVGAQLFSTSAGTASPYTTTVNAMIQAASPTLTLPSANIAAKVCTAVSSGSCTTWSSACTDSSSPTCLTLLNSYAGNPAQVTATYSWSLPIVQYTYAWTTTASMTERIQ
jgi:Flp pilus assembly protein TadG